METSGSRNRWRIAPGLCGAVQQGRLRQRQVEKQHALRLGLAGALHYLDVDTIHYSSQHADWAAAQHVHSHSTFGHHTAQRPDMHHAGYVQGLIWYSYFTGEPIGLLGAQGIADWVLRSTGVQTTAMERILGHRPEQITTLAAWRDLVHPDDVEGINAIAGERCSPHPHNFTDRLIRPGDQAFFDVIQSFMGYRTCYYRTFNVGRATSAGQRWRSTARELLWPLRTRRETSSADWRNG